MRSYLGDTAPTPTPTGWWSGWISAAEDARKAAGLPPGEPLTPDYSHPDNPGGHWVWQPLSDQAEYRAYAASRGISIPVDNEIGQYFNTLSGRYWVDGGGNPYTVDRYGSDIGWKLANIERDARARSAGSAAAWRLVAVAAMSGAAAAFFGGSAAATTAGESGTAAGEGAAAAGGTAAELTPITLPEGVATIGVPSAAVQTSTLMTMPTFEATAAAGGAQALSSALKNPATVAAMKSGAIPKPPVSVLTSQFKDWAVAQGVSTLESKLGRALTPSEQQAAEAQLEAQVAQLQNELAANGEPNYLPPSSDLNSEITSMMTRENLLKYGVIGGIGLLALWAFA